MTEPTDKPEAREELLELKRRREMALQMGGAESVQRQRSLGKLPVRERIDALLDAGSFREIGTLTGTAVYSKEERLDAISPTSLIFGRGRIEGRPIVVAGDDWTVREGPTPQTLQKMTYAEQMANQLKIPIVRLIDSGGGSVKGLDRYQRTSTPYLPGWDWVTSNLATVPVVCLGLGPCAGLPAARFVSGHYTVLVRRTGFMFTAGPAVVAAAGFPATTKEELGGAEIHARSGAVDDIAESELDAFAKARRFLSYLPSSIEGLPPRLESEDPPDRCESWLDEIVPKNRRQVYKMRRILEGILDVDSFFEIGKHWGKSIIAGFARLDGWPVAVLASDQTVYGGSWTAESSQKIVRFVELAETFHLPVVHFVDVPGILIGIQAEKAATMRHAVRALGSVYQATVPWCSVIVRKAFGVGGAGMMNQARLRYRYSWPTGDWGSLPVQGGIEVGYKDELAAAEDPEMRRLEIEERLDRVRSPFRTAEDFQIEEIIAPRETRPLLCEFANLAAPLRRLGKMAFGFRP